MDHGNRVMKEREHTDEKMTPWFPQTYLGESGGSRIPDPTRVVRDYIPGTTTSNSVSRIPSPPNGYRRDHTPMTTRASSGVATASDAPVVQSAKDPKPSGMADSIWAVPSVPTTTPKTNTSNKTASYETLLLVSQTQTETPSGLARPASRTHMALDSLEFVESVLLDWQRNASPATAEFVNTVVLDWQKLHNRLPQKLAAASNATPLVEKATMALIVPPVTGTLQKMGTSCDPRALDSVVGDDFDIVAHADADEDFDIVSGEGPSASNGTFTPDLDAVMDGLDGAFCSLGECGQDRMDGG